MIVRLYLLESACKLIFRRKLLYCGQIVQLPKISNHNEKANFIGVESGFSGIAWVYFLFVSLVHL